MYNKYNEYDKLRDIFICFLLITLFIQDFSLNQERRFTSFMFSEQDKRQEQSYDAIVDTYSHIDTQYAVLKLLVTEPDYPKYVKSVVKK